MLNTGLTRGLNRGLQRLAGGGGRSIFTPASIANLPYWQAGPTWCFTDAAGTVPCAVGDAIYVQKPAFGPAINLVQATLAQRPILRQDGNGKYYREYTSTKRMSATVASALANTPASFGAALNIAAINIDGTILCHEDISGTGAGLQFGQVGTGNRFGLTSGGGQFASYGGTVATGTQSLICVSTGVAASTPAYSRNGTALSNVANTLTFGVRTTVLVENSRFAASASQGTANLVYASFYFPTVLTAAEIAALHTYNQSLYA